MDTLIQLDKELLIWLNSHNTPFWDVVMMFFTRKEFWIPLYLLLLYQIYKVKGKEALWWILGAFFLIFLCDQISTQLFKNVFERFRPSHDPSLEGIVNLVSGYKGGRYGFVSSHATNSFGFALFTSLLFRNKLYTFFIFSWSLLVIYTRIYLGVHFPGDVIGGMILGLILGYAVYRLCKWFTSSRSGSVSRGRRSIDVLNYSAVWLIVAVASVEILTICLVVRKLLKYGLF
ncbi:phosphatase PAP2 family protein [Marinifilum caeruleilacunae]|uniref:Phosphatase PAP2 family protein n=1 Tax=Marinifilum caeruleilacunae TaxID=2499076 RepID=A0ABX1WRR2_9BACT|nr:phosphatase PAP2 family protein [Marinifilum caeruleilacunae]NOU58766.1 phosphatase PAP2 family protein [Marinifilum caeruleilacunae]